MLKTMDALEEEIKYYAMLPQPKQHYSRLKGIGRLSHEDVIKFGAVGPVARRQG
jgi:Ni,Fe-hydrogenase III large subunit